MTNFSSENLYIMGYNLKNARNGKSASKIPKWPKFEALIIEQWEEQGKEMESKALLESKVSSIIFHTNPINLRKIQIVVNLTFNARGLKFGHFGIFYALINTEGGGGGDLRRIAKNY